MPDVHKTEPVLVWADIDVLMIPVIKHLNSIPGVRTWACCQGTLQDEHQGPHPYGPYVMANWPEEKLLEILSTYDVKIEGNNWGYIYPREPVTPQAYTQALAESGGTTNSNGDPASRKIPVASSAAG